MPNYCNYIMQVQGKKENVEEFVKIIKADYDYDTLEFSADRHMFRIFEADIIEDDSNEQGIRRTIIDGYCAWSVLSCMTDDSVSYYADLKKSEGENFRGTTLQKESEKLGLAIQVYSEETGCGFQEHFVYINGEEIENDSVEYSENYMTEQDELDEYNKKHGTSYTLKELDEHDNMFPEGGYENYGEFIDYSDKIIIDGEDKE